MTSLVRCWRCSVSWSCRHRWCHWFGVEGVLSLDPVDIIIGEDLKKRFLVVLSKISSDSWTLKLRRSETTIWTALNCNRMLQCILGNKTMNPNHLKNWAYIRFQNPLELYQYLLDEVGSDVWEVRCPRFGTHFVFFDLIYLVFPKTKVLCIFRCWS